jgi:PAS domain S-box-containing protein
MSASAWNKDIKELIRRLAEAQSAIKISTSSQVDAVLDQATATPILLRDAQEALLKAKDELEKQVMQRTKELVKSEARFREMAELLPDMIYEMDASLNINYANLAAYETLGYSQEEFAEGINISQLMAGDEIKCISEAFSTISWGQPHQLRTYRMRKKDGSIFFCELKSAPIQDSDGNVTGFRGIFRDITEHMMADEQLKRYSDNLEILVEDRTRQLRDAERLAAIGETAVMIGHDLRNPLQNLVTTTYLAKLLVENLSLLDQNGLERQDLMAYLSTIEEQSNYMNRIVSDLQDYARPLSPEMRSVNIRPFMNKVLTDIRIPPDIEVQVEIEDKLTWNIDPTMMIRVLANIITNAVQAMPGGGRLAIAAAKSEGDVVLTVIDNGVGISSDIMPKIFSPLVTTKARGMGMGLSVGKRLLEAQGGSISIDSEVDRGTVLVIRVPYKHI